MSRMTSRATNRFYCGVFFYYKKGGKVRLKSGKAEPKEKPFSTLMVEKRG